MGHYLSFALSKHSEKEIFGGLLSVLLKVLCFEWWIFLPSGVIFWWVALKISLVCIEGGVHKFPSCLTSERPKIIFVGKLLLK